MNKLMAFLMESKQEFNRIMSPVIEAQENGSFDHIYAEKNPNTSKI